MKKHVNATLALALLASSSAFADRPVNRHSSWEEIEANRHVRFNYPVLMMPAGYVAFNQLCMRDSDTVEALDLYAEKCVRRVTTRDYRSECVEWATVKQSRSVYYQEKTCLVGPAYACMREGYVTKRVATSAMVPVYSNTYDGIYNPLFHKAYSIPSCQ